MNPDIRLLIVDPQNDFCDIDPASAPAGCVPALPVPGADADMRRLAAALRAGAARISRLAVTLDAHRRWDIAHPDYWMRGDGAPVAPFTAIAAQAVRAGAYMPRRAQDLARTLAYLDTLERQGRYVLMVWPVHCEVGTWGQRMHASVDAACQAWSAASGRAVYHVTKGLNPYTEHYSAVQAEVPDADDPATQSNHALLEWAGQADELLIAGEASSHCVRATVEHLVAQLGADAPRRMTLLVDCMSPVAGFEAQHAAFLADMAARGVRARPAAQALGLAA